MSAHYSKFGLNSYYGTPYFEANLPPDYPIDLILQGARAFRRLPPNLRELASESKEWAEANNVLIDGIDQWYDEEGYELDPSTGNRLTDAEIDADWPGWSGPEVPMVDIPKPVGGFPDPMTWQPPQSIETERDHPSPQQILKDVASRGIAKTEEEYGINLGIAMPKEPTDISFDEAKALFAARTEKVLGSTYFQSDPHGKAALEGILPIDLHGDLWGDAEDTFDRVEEYEAVKAKLGL
jgi:hypothetical protein